MYLKSNLAPSLIATLCHIGVESQPPKPFDFPAVLLRSSNRAPPPQFGVKSRKQHSKSSTICTFCRPPNSAARATEDLFSEIEEAILMYKHVIIGGDLNVDLLAST